MITFAYDPINGLPVSDGMVETEYKNIMRLKDTGLPLMTTYSTDNIFAYVRLQIALDNLDCKDVRFSYGDKVFCANEYGAILDWPDGFCDYMPLLCEKIIRTQIYRRKKKKIEEEKAKFEEKKNEHLS